MNEGYAKPYCLWIFNSEAFKRVVVKIVIYLVKNNFGYVP